MSQALRLQALGLSVGRPAGHVAVKTPTTPKAAPRAQVILGARRTDRLQAVAERIRSDGGRASALRLDVTDADGVRAVVDQIVAEHGRIDVIVNNAGVMPLSRPTR